MWRFVSYICIYILLIIAIILPIEIHKMHLSVDNGSVPGAEVRCAEKISKRKVNGKIRKLILGDSTGHALYPCEKEYDEIISLACNRAISFAGHYFLLKNFIETNPDNLPQEIIILNTPFSFSCDLDQYAYQYFLKPFPLKEYKYLYTDYLYQRVKSIPFYWTANLPFIQTSGYTPRMAVPIKGPKVSMSVLSMEYLLKIDSLSKLYDISLSIYSTPVRDDKKSEIAKLAEDCMSMYDSIIASHMQKYFGSIKYYPSELFYDGVHLCDENVPSDYLVLLEK